MATITIGISGVTGGPNGSLDYTITDAHVARWIAAWRKIAGLPASTTDAQVLADWADFIIDHTKRAVMDREQKDATPTALDITPA